MKGDDVAEPAYWLRLIERARFSRRPTLAQAISEAGELVAILKASARTARKRAS